MDTDDPVAVADDFAVRIALACFDGGPPPDLLLDVLADSQMAMQVFATLGYLTADMAIAAAGGDEAAARANIVDAFTQ